MVHDNKTEAEKLAALRAKIDAVDESIHNLLMQRAGVIDELIKIKGASTTKGAAFRPGREASMMEVLAERHSGTIPFSMIGHVWREIISTFTHMQAGYSVHMAGNAQDNDALHDVARYQFGFTVPLLIHETTRQALDAVQIADNAIAIIAASTAGAWWDELGQESGLMVMTHLPVHDLPFEAPSCFCVAPPLSDPSPFDVRLYAAKISANTELGHNYSGTLLASALQDNGQASVMIGLRQGEKAPPGLLDIRAIGGYFAPSVEV